MVIRKVDGVCSSTNFNFLALYELEIRFSDNPRQKEPIGSITWLRRKKCLIYRLDIIFSITHVAQVTVSKINFFCQGYSYISEEGYQTSYQIRKLKNGNGWLFLWDTWSRCLEKLQFTLMETRQISNLRKFCQI